MDKIILASSSPRRKELLRQMGLAFTVMASNMEESIADSVPKRVVENLAKGKALDVAGKVVEGSIIIGADTVVVAEGRILGKPVDEEDAFFMLQMLQGKKHSVHTGVAIIHKTASGMRKEVFSVCTQVEVWPMSEKEIKEYVSTGEPMDKAGAYGIQGLFSKYVKGIKGDYNNVVGLPVSALYQRLKDF